MNDRTSTAILISQADSHRLDELVRSSRYRSADSARLAELRKELEQCTVVAVPEIPLDLVTMRSRVRIKDLATRGEETFTLVYPEEASMFDGKLSVLAPLGAALLGARVGETLHVKVPAGVRHIRVTHLQYQPEAAGDFDL